MPAEITRCTDCGAPLKGVPSWMAPAHVKFTCTNCPKRPSRAPRIEPIVEASVVHPDEHDLVDPDAENDDEAETDMELPIEDAEDDASTEE